MKVISYGGGVQSTAMLVLANQGVIEGVDAALFSNVGDDSEHPATLDYIRDVATPRSGIPVHTLQRIKRDGSVETLWGRLMKPESRSLPIPIRMANGAQRVNRKRAEAYEKPTYPLIDLGMDRSACQQVIADYGWPVPPKSSCYFCPFHRDLTWSEMRRDEPDLFAKAVALEATLNERRDKLGKDSVYLTRHARPLDQAIGEAQDMLPLIEWDTCDSGHCMT